MGVITLQVIDGADRGKVFERIATPVTIGREEGNRIQLNDERVSRFHLKIQEDQDKYVLTDLESTNGTKVNGEDIQLRLLRFGDIIALGRSVLIFGSREQIAERVAALKGDPSLMTGMAPAGDAKDANPEDLGFSVDEKLDNEPESLIPLSEPPKLPEKLSPVQAAQLAEVLDYLHFRIRDLIAAVKVDPRGDRVVLEAEPWHGLVDLQSRLAGYVRSIVEPKGE